MPIEVAIEPCWTGCYVLVLSNMAKVELLTNGYRGLPDWDGIPYE